jgi:hypothetical protein
MSGGGKEKITTEILERSACKMKLLITFDGKEDQRDFSSEVFND